VPLLPFAEARLRPAMLLYCVSSLAYYAIHLPLNCVTETSLFVTREVLEGAIVILPPAALLYAQRRGLARG
jgi:hypothetical protein